MPTSSPALVPANIVMERLLSLVADRKVRPIVTKSGRRARGRVHSRKTHIGCFESLVEADCLRLLEVASDVHRFVTHPWVLRLYDPSTQTYFHYTPDVYVEFQFAALVIEVKAHKWLTVEPSRSRTLQVIRALRHHEVPVALIDDRDLRAGDRHEEWKDLLRMRPVTNRRVTGLDVHQWDPTSISSPCPDVLRRWLDAQRECNELLSHLLRREPSEHVDMASA